MKRMRIISRAAILRLGVLALVAGAVIFLCWRTMIEMPLESYSGPWIELNEVEAQTRESLRRAVRQLAGTIGERNVFRPVELKAAANFVAAELAKTGLHVQREPFTVSGEQCENLEVEIAGSSASRDVIVIGAHYDSVFGSPGANDNASGTAALLVLAEKFAKTKPARNLRFVAFVNEEPPHFQTAEMGSYVYAQKCRQQNDAIVAMLSLETIGYYSDKDRSQKYPFPLGTLYPSRGNFIAFVSDTSSEKLLKHCIGLFRRHARFPSEGAALPDSLPGISWSDHWSFWQFGYPAIMVTDTAPFRYPHYHTLNDTPDKLDYDRMARVVAGLEIMIKELASERK